MSLSFYDFQKQKISFDINKLNNPKEVNYGKKY